jgi:dTDP-4-amino-4,6-dideoxygalactose transaminase
MAMAYPSSRSTVPAVAGGSALFPEGLPLARPSLPPVEDVLGDVTRIIESGVLTNGPYVRRFEERCSDYLGVANCVAVSSCTAGLMLVLRAAGLAGDVVVPSFTFAATVHAASWNGLPPTFADVDPVTLTLSPESVARAIGVRTSAILATHLYGTPCDVESLEEVAASHGVPLFFDAAHAFGSRHGERHVGTFGQAEVFSLSPTKVLVATEGGIIATNDDTLAERCRIGRDYGNPGDYDCRFVGLNARMSETHAAIALRSLDYLDERIARRNALASRYREGIASVRGIAFPEVRPGDRSTYKDFTILVDPEAFGAEAAWLSKALGAEGIDTRRYYSPPVHRMRAYRRQSTANGNLHVTETAAERVLTLPMWTEMRDEHVDRVASAIERVHRWLVSAGVQPRVVPDLAVDATARRNAPG